MTGPGLHRQRKAETPSKSLSRVGCGSEGKGAYDDGGNIGGFITPFVNISFSLTLLLNGRDVEMNIVGLGRLEERSSVLEAILIQRLAVRAT